MWLFNWDTETQNNKRKRRSSSKSKIIWSSGTDSPRLCWNPKAELCSILQKKKVWGGEASDHMSLSPRLYPQLLPIPPSHPCPPTYTINIWVM